MSLTVAWRLYNLRTKGLHNKSMIDKEIGKHIRKFRLARNLSMRDLADGIGFSKTLICDVENGKKNPKRVLQQLIGLNRVIKPRSLTYRSRRS